MLPRASFALVAMQIWSVGPTPQSQGVSAADSTRIAREARSAQSAFEAFRRNRLPVGYSYGNPCDIRIGRYCYWRGDEDDENPPLESSDITRRRNELIRTLDSAARAVPGDAWIAGQHVRYLVEAERIDDALAFASRECRAGVAWCAALAGYAAHVGQRFQTADSAYAIALAAMPDAERCAWLDISSLLEDELARRVHDADCARRDTLTRRLFWLGAPLYSVASTDLRTEHFARLTRIRIVERAASVDGASWADDQRELVTRYGWPRWYSRTPPSPGYQDRPSYTGHDVGVPYNFFPAPRAVDTLGATSAEDWRLADPRSRTGYSPAYARTLHELPSQIALFRRGDSTLAVAAWDGRRDTTLLGRNLDAALVLASPDGRVAITRANRAKASGSIAVAGVIDSGVVSLELLAREDRRAARARRGIPPRTTERVALSDLLLYAADTAPAYDLDAVLESALPSAVLPAARAVGVYWETYGLDRTSEPVHFTLTVERVGVGWMRSIAERLRFADPTSALRVQWTEVPRQRDGIAGRGVRVDLSRLRGGRYRMTLSARVDGATEVVSSREIEIR